jgi:serine/threonine protein kinase
MHSDPIIIEGGYILLATCCVYGRRLGHCLGAGNFGTVVQGLANLRSGEVKVAVKTLKEGSGEEEKVKFLQEAAIMGQFRHPNVVKLHGVIVEDEPVCKSINAPQLGGVIIYEPVPALEVLISSAAN